MKIRTSFVANSSSSSFILVTKNRDYNIYIDVDDKPVNLTEYYQLDCVDDWNTYTYPYAHIPNSIINLHRKNLRFCDSIYENEIYGTCEISILLVKRLYRKIYKKYYREIVNFIKEYTNSTNIKDINLEAEFYSYKDFEDKFTNYLLDKDEYDNTNIVDAALQDSKILYKDKLEEYCYYTGKDKHDLINLYMVNDIRERAISSIWSFITKNKFYELVVPRDGEIDMDDKISEYINSDIDCILNQDSNFEIVNSYY